MLLTAEKHGGEGLFHRPLPGRGAPIFLLTMKLWQGQRDSERRLWFS
jgi:hypothetical protein